MSDPRSSEAIKVATTIVWQMREAGLVVIDRENLKAEIAAVFARVASERDAIAPGPIDFANGWNRPDVPQTPTKLERNESEQPGEPPIVDPE